MDIFDWEDSINQYQDDLIDFDPIPHTYTNARTRERYLGVTTFISQFEPEFDFEYWSAREAVKRYYGETSFKYMAFKRVVRKPVKDGHGKIKVADKQIVTDFINRSEAKNMILITQNQVKQEWRTENKIAIDKGSAYHERQENKLNYNQFRIANSGLINKLANFNEIPNNTINSNGKINLSYQLPDGAYAEILMRNHKYKLCGQADYMYIETAPDGVTRYVDIDDYKSNKKLTEQNLYDNFLNPLQFLQHTKINIYKLQLHLYAFMAREYGFTIRRLTITHQPDYHREPTIHEIHKFSPNYPDPIKLMLEVRKTQFK